MNLEVRIDRLLDEQTRSFYWLAKETGISYTTLWRLKNGKALGIHFSTLEKICVAIGCEPGDILVLAGERTGESSTPRGNRGP